MDIATNFIQLFEQQVLDVPHKKAIIAGEIVLSYAELNAKANALAKILQDKIKLDTCADKIFAICLKREAKLAIATLAVAKLGGAFMFLDPTYSEHRIATYVEKASPLVIITSTESNHNLASMNSNLLVSLENLETSGKYTTLVNQPNSLAYVVFTSGTTGAPKAIQIEQRSLSNLLGSFKQILNINNNDVWLSVTSPVFDIFLLELLLPLITGATCVLYDKGALYDGSELKNAISKYNPTFIQATPSLWKLLAGEGLLLSPDTIALCGGERLDAPLAKQLCANFKKVFNVYGPSETTVWSSFTQISPDSLVTIGQPIANTDLYLLNETMEVITTEGVTGELYIGGDGLSRGYLNEPELTNKNFIYHPLLQKRLYKSGDLMQLSPNGEYVFVGRADHQIKINGHRVELEGIEQSALALEAVTQVCAVLSQQQDIYLFYVTKDKNLDESLLAAEIYKILSREVPVRFKQLTAFPLTINGKIDRAKLKKDLSVAPSAVSSDQQSTQELIYQVWKEILRVDDFPHNKSFVLLGGNSLHAPQIINKLNKLLNVRLTIRAFIENQTVEKLALHIEKQQSRAQSVASMSDSQSLSSASNAAVFSGSTVDVPPGDIPSVSPAVNASVFSTIVPNVSSPVIPSASSPVIPSAFSTVIPTKEGSQ